MTNTCPDTIEKVLERVQLADTIAHYSVYSLSIVFIPVMSRDNIYYRENILRFFIAPLKSKAAFVPVSY